MAFLASPQHLTPDSTVAQTIRLLERCSSVGELKQIHAHVSKTGLAAETLTMSKLLAISLSLDSGNMAYAYTVFNKISRPNTFTWNIMIRGYANSNQPEQALILYHQMLYHSVPHNAYTFPFLLKACSSLSAMDETQQVHSQIVKLGFSSEVYTANSLLRAYATSACIIAARTVFDRIPDRDIVSWNVMIDAYMKSGEIEVADKTFQEMPKKNAVSWTTMISGYVQLGLSIKALGVFQEMQIAGVQPDKVGMTSMLSACAYLGALDQGRWIHAYIKKNGTKIDPILGCVLTDMYAKCGSMSEAVDTFTKMTKKDVSVWTAIISGFANHGHGREALEWFLQMQEEGIKPNAVTFTAILTACSYAGLVNEGKSLFKSMMRVYNLNPTVEHYGCMVDLLGRAGLLEEAKDFIETMPVEPNAIIWGALLNACMKYGDLELGKQIGKILTEVDPYHAGRYIHLASVHAAAGEWKLAAEARREMKQRGVLKVPGFSTISLNGVVHGFVAGEQSHPQMEEIWRKWHHIGKRLRQEGYEPATQDLLLDLQDGEKEVALNQHSEKLAVALGLIRTQPGTTVRIIKNLRVCEDCHTAIKLISKIYDREIVMRDRARFHHLKNGKCTCGDYW